MHTAKSLKNKIKKIKKSYYIFMQQRKLQKICITMHFRFNIQFIKVMRTRPIFQNFQKNYFVFF
jgi:hypothetical protein